MSCICALYLSEERGHSVRLLSHLQFRGSPSGLLHYLLNIVWRFSPSDLSTSTRDVCSTSLEDWIYLIISIKIATFPLYSCALNHMLPSQYIEHLLQIFLPICITSIVNLEQMLLCWLPSQYIYHLDSNFCFFNLSMLTISLAFNFP